MTDYNENSVQPNDATSTITDKEHLPSSLAALILGVISLLHMAFFGWIPAIFALKQANRALQKIEENPDRYTENSINMAHAGKRMGNIGLIMGILGMFVTFIYYYWIIYSALHHHSMFYFNEFFK